MPEMHATEEELILHYYGEIAAGTRVTSHVATCAHCRQALEELRNVLALVDARVLPEPLEGLEQRVWARMQPEIEARAVSWWSRLFSATPKWAFAGGVAALVIAAFVAGRVTKIDTTLRNTPQIADRSAAENAGRLIDVAVGDHLDESQMVLLELLNADTSRIGSIEAEQMRARELVATNRLYRHTAVRAGDESVREVLDALERVLQEIANAPPDVSARELEALRADIEQRGILFRLRVVTAEMRAREQKDALGTPVGP